MRPILAISAAVCVALLAIPAAACAQPQRQAVQIAVLGCVTGDSDVAVRSDCRTVPGARPEDTSTGLAGAAALLPGSEGKSLYVVGNQDSALTRLALGPPPGRILFGSCFTGNTFLRECTNVPGAQANAVQSPVANPTAAAISPDGRSLYVTSGDFHGSTVARFSRDPVSGEIAYGDCLTGERGAGPGGTGACSLIPSATETGYGSGLADPSGIAISSNGSHVYVTAALDQSVAVFARDPSTGVLEFKQCISSNRRATSCTQVRSGQGVLDEVMTPLISANGRFLYTAAKRAGTIDTFALNGLGGITYLRCMSGADSSPTCGHGNDFPGGAYTLQTPADLIEAPDGRYVYASSTNGAIAVLRRNRKSGRLSPSSCISGFIGDRGKCTLVPKASRLAAGSPLYGVRTPILSRNGKTIYVAVRGEDGVTELRRNPRTGALTFLGCVTGNLQFSTARKGVCTKLPGATAKGVASGFSKTGVLARGPGDLLYAAAPRDSTVSVLRPKP